MIDYESEATLDAAPDSSQLKIISDLAAKQVRLEMEATQLESQLKAKQKELRQVQEVDLPDAMAAAGCKAYTTQDGRGISIKEDISASLSEGKKPAAIAWLKENGHGDIVKEKVSLDLGKGEESLAREIAASIQESFNRVPVVSTDVNTATLKSLIRELRARGEDVPMETLGAYEWKKAVIK